MINNNQMTRGAAVKILKIFDENMPTVMRENVVKRSRDDVRAEGELMQYKNLEKVWSIDGANMTITTGFTTSTHKRVRFIMES
eukprot:CAMPEP_0119051908 /NCGR_PEP_ID=MMETSP1177-20130426/73367_1 /TAXON_ID=2985 /ORGANISM="Ochromonas sp, Strain CCMP1899" /LENGTH=82 /DNA_ID=CAMNT_0007031279 /DNA_START=363 /DNA_END=611 /DNA_ORIENTATION=+